MLGDNFMNEAYGPNRAPGQANNLRGGRYGGQNQQQGQAYPPAPQPDLGILKALSSMGAAAKRNLTQLAQGFNSTGNNSNSNGDNSNTGGSGTRSNRNSGEGNPSYVSRGGFGGGSPPTGRAAPKSHSTRKKGAFNDLEVLQFIFILQLFPCSITDADSTLPMFAVTLEFRLWLCATNIYLFFLLL